MSANILEDERVKWIRQRVLMSMDIPMETFNYYFTDSLERARSAGQAREELATFLTEKYTAGSSLFFSCKKWYEEVEIEEEVSYIFLFNAF